MAPIDASIVGDRAVQTSAVSVVVFMVVMNECPMSCDEVRPIIATKIPPSRVNVVSVSIVIDEFDEEPRSNDSEIAIAVGKSNRVETRSIDG